MEYNELFYEFLDGTLDQENEQELFISLASNDELRKELKHIVAINSAVKSDISAFQPSKESETKILSALGFSLFPSTVSPSSIPSKSILTGSKFWSYLSIGIISALTTAIIMLLFSNDQTTPELQNLVAKPDTIYIEKAPISANNDVPEIHRSTIRNVKTNYIASNQHQNQVSVPEDEVENTPGIQETISLAEFVQLKHISRDKFYTNPRQFSELLRPELSQPHISSNFSLQMRGHTNWYFTEPLIHPEKYQYFNNLSIALLYNVNQEIVIGLAYRRDNYLQKFHISENGKIYEITQQPNFDNFTFAFQYNPNIIILEYFKPISELDVGFNEVGYVGSVMLGTEILPDNFTSFVLGFELSNLFFREQNKWYISNKYGIIYGIKMKL